MKYWQPELREVEFSPTVNRKKGKDEGKTVPARMETGDYRKDGYLDG